MEKRSYCPSCGVQVVVRSEYLGHTRLERCAQCGLVLMQDDAAVNKWYEDAARIDGGNLRAGQEVDQDPDLVGEDSPLEVDLGPPLAPAAPQAPPRARRKKPPLRRVVVAQPSVEIQDLLSRILLGKGLVQEVVRCTTGDELLSEVTRLLLEGERVNLILLDVDLKILGGLASGIALRAVERAMALSKSIPLLFLSTRVADERIKRALQSCQPAGYVNRSADAPLQELAGRVEFILSQLLHKSAKK